MSSAKKMRKSLTCSSSPKETLYGVSYPYFTAIKDMIRRVFAIRHFSRVNKLSNMPYISLMGSSPENNKNSIESNRFIPAACHGGKKKRYGIFNIPLRSRPTIHAILTTWYRMHLLGGDVQCHVYK